MEAWERDHDGRADEASDAAVDQALAQAEEIATALNVAWRERALEPLVSVKLSSGSEGEPVLAFTIWVALEEDFDPEDYPADLIHELDTSLRAHLSSRINGVRWFSKVNSRSPAAA